MLGFQAIIDSGKLRRFVYVLSRSHKLMALCFLIAFGAVRCTASIAENPADPASEAFLYTNILHCLLHDEQCPGSIDSSSDSCGEGPTTGLVMHYKFEGDAQDATANANHGIQQGTVNYSTGVCGEAVSLDGGAGNYIQVPDATSIRVGGNVSFSVTAWVNIPDNGNYVVFDKTSATVTELVLSQSVNATTPNMLQWPVGGTAETDIATSSLSTSTWMHIAYVYNASVSTGENRFYINGAAAGVLTKTTDCTAIAPNTADANVGAFQQGSSDFFKGNIDELRVYNRTIDQTEVQTIYASRGNLP